MFKDDLHTLNLHLQPGTLSNRDSDTGAFLRILWTFLEQVFCKTNSVDTMSEHTLTYWSSTAMKAGQNYKSNLNNL